MTMKMIPIWIIACLLAVAVRVDADPHVFYRIESSAETSIVDFSSDSVFIWSNSVPWSRGRIQWSASLRESEADWKDVHYFAANTEIMGLVMPPTPHPPGLALIPAGWFMMGNATNMFSWQEGWTDELPQHPVYTSAFYMDPFHVTQEFWSEVRDWGSSRGYTDLPIGSWRDGANYSKGPTHPVHLVNWFDCVKWCNARSEKDGLTPVYYTDAEFTSVYQTGEEAPFVNWDANGYRLPTEAEWEKAARGGFSNRRFPWFDSNEIEHERANYFSRTNELFDTSTTREYHPAYAVGEEPFTSPVGAFSPNAYGLYDMAGNVFDWCWDWYSGTYYQVSPSHNPRGPDNPFSRILRGGSWYRNAIRSRVSHRAFNDPTGKSDFIGFRCVRVP